MNELLFRVADKCMAEAIAGLFDRQGWDQAIRCRRFDFDSRRDIKVASGQNDCGLFSHGKELLVPFAQEYRRVVTVVDEEWVGSPGQDAIRRRLQEHLLAAGWSRDNSLSLVVSPEADVWLWSDSVHSAKALGWNDWDSLRPALEAQGWLRPGEFKPDRPKEAAEWALKNCGHRAPRSAALYREVSSRVGIGRCKDSALEQLLTALRTWFPPEAA